ncbi:hypothetical protein HZH66_004330 [Vespula vulgaris]|uniref:long-chain-fatty-acid--CoA ligase n=1 Tax=Vespula vulgaris TaxID=7454 RepID=A0A834NES4_VESVU|nr:hypothetical protein HZH66_004330 [Vespula vulgaris]
MFESSAERLLRSIDRREGKIDRSKQVERENMTAVQPVSSNSILNGYTRNDKVLNGSCIRYAVASKTGLDGPDQVLMSDVNVTTEANGRIRIQLGEDINATLPVSVPGVLSAIAKKYPDQIALVSRPGPDGTNTIYTYKEYETEVKTVAKAFLKLGLERYHSVCILGFNSPQWFISDIAAIYAGGFAAGIYTTNSPEACQYCAQHSKANIIVVEDSKQLEKILQIKKHLVDLKAIIQYEGIPKEKDILSWDELLEIGKKESDDKLEGVLKTIGVNECCTLVYTSGTVGNPKAVMLSHDNLIHDSRAIRKYINFIDTEEILISYLPLSHVAAQIVDIFLSMSVAGTVYFADKNALKGSLIETLLVAKPTAFLGVPRVWEKIYEKMQLVARNNGRVKTWIATWAKSQGLIYNTNKMNGIDYKHWGYIIAKWLVFDKVKTNLDIPIMEAFGMSESSGAHTITSSNNCRLGSVGSVLPGFRTKLDNPNETGEGEICMYGRHIFMGYLNEPEKTKETKDEEGWLHSGDLGRLDSNGLLYVTGRIKELIITAGGENVPPVHIEQLILSELPVLSNALLIGDKRKYLTVLVTLKSEVKADTGEPLDTLIPSTLTWLKSIGSNAKTVTDIVNSRDPLVLNEIEEAIKRANTKAISNAQKVQKFRILPHDFSIPTGELGPTLKLKRNIVYNMYADLIEEMYQ